jgi:Protein of unknown function (DUF1006).
MSLSALLRERMTRHGLAVRPGDSSVAAAARTTAVQAQDNLASRLGVRARASGVTDADVRRAIETDRTVARTWLMRGTIHLVDAADLRWLLRLIGPAVQRRYRTRWRQLGLTEDVLDGVLTLLPDVLADGPRTRPEIRTALAERGLRLEHPDPQVHSHAVVFASTAGLVCRGPDRGRNSTFVLLDDWLPDAPAGPSGDDALAELARRYFAAYSPATAADFATWSGLPAAHAVSLIRDELTSVEVDGRTLLRLGEASVERGLRLLPAWDNYLVGYRDRSAVIAPELQPQVFQGGWIRPTVVLDGRVVGTWTQDNGAGRVTVDAFEPLTRAARNQVEREVADLGRFLDRGLDLAFSP